MAPRSRRVVPTTTSVNVPTDRQEAADAYAPDKRRKVASSPHTASPDPYAENSDSHAHVDSDKRRKLAVSPAVSPKAAAVVVKPASPNRREVTKQHPTKPESADVATDEEDFFQEGETEVACPTGPVVSWDVSAVQQFCRFFCHERKLAVTERRNLLEKFVRTRGADLVDLLPISTSCESQATNPFHLASRLLSEDKLSNAMDLEAAQLFCVSLARRIREDAAAPAAAAPATTAAPPTTTAVATTRSPTTSLAVATGPSPSTAAPPTASSTVATALSAAALSAATQEAAPEAEAESELHTPHPGAKRRRTGMPPGALALPTPLTRSPTDFVAPASASPLPARAPPSLLVRSPTDLFASTDQVSDADAAQPESALRAPVPLSRCALSDADIERYARHLVIPAVGVAGQLRIAKAKMLVIGAGGLGSPLCLYLAAAGVGKLGIVDGDAVERSNLHRQVVHQDYLVGVNKAVSARAACLRLNPSLDVVAHSFHLGPENAVGLVSQYDLLVDCSDNVPTRYLCNDAAVFCGKPLVSGSAVGAEGQVTVYNHGGAGPCYRCLFPSPPSAVTNCADGGVVGVVPGIVGTIQALEALKVCGGVAGDALSGRLLVLDGLAMRFSEVRLGKRRDGCLACGPQTQLSKQWFEGEEGRARYSQVCAAVRPQTGGVDVHELARVLKKAEADAQIECLLLDVRDQVQFEICSLRPRGARKRTVHIPLRVLQTPEGISEFESALPKGEEVQVFCICRRGVDSLAATQLLQEKELFKQRCKFHNVQGGLQAWTRDIDPLFPLY